MQVAGGHASLESFHLQVAQWVERHISPCVDALSQKLLDKAMSNSNRETALMFFKHHKYLENHSGKISASFQHLLSKALFGEDTSVAVIPAQRTSPDFKTLLSATSYDDDLYSFCLVLRPEVLTTLFQRAFNLIDPAQPASQTARSVFDAEFNSQLDSLYAALSKLIDSPDTSNIDRRANIEAWIQHLETKLRNPAIDASTRSMTQKRLEELRSKLNDLDSLSQSARQFRDRWLHPHDELEHKVYSDDELLSDVDKLFQPLNTMEHVPRSLQKLSERIRPIVDSVALSDRNLFMQALHPAKQLIHQVTATVAQWVESSPDQRRQMLINVKQSIDTGITLDNGHRGDRTLLKALHQELTDYLAYQMHRVDSENQPEANTASTTTDPIDQVNALLDEKLHNAGDVPPLLYKLIYSLWNRVIAKIWLEYGREGIATQQALSLVDDILWYLHCDDEKLIHTNTDFLGQQIERDLLNGLKLIDFDQDKGIELISSLRQLRERLQQQSRRTALSAGL
ncbi:hypothetical protein FHR99_001386 [Litorivivens lipolytica]|uniref:Uncharacterized protein n=1 Tax=Litorivivens lipolytica TaxID=1524264 RepID=A0A7W4Z6P3_9GAMM|nr:DUF1631 family protein [Litorivivens lipolytica]MBB3047150.1 hypothetical protein [Litorivivens lipolytica]